MTVQLVVQSHSGRRGADGRCESREAETNAMPRRGTAADQRDVRVFRTCSGGGGAGVSFTESHKCATDPTYLFLHPGERGAGCDLSRCTQWCG